MQAGVGLSTELVAEAAARGAAKAAMDRLGHMQASLTFVFASYHYQEKYPVLVSLVRAITGSSQLVGCSASGVLAPGGEFEGVPAVVVLVVRDPAMTPLTFITPGNLASPGAVKELTDTLKPGPDWRQTGSAEGGFMMLFPDVIQEPPAVTMKVIEDSLGFMPIVGGAALGDPASLKCFKFCGNEVATDALSGALVRSSGSILVGVTHGCQPVGRPFTVTKADGNIIWEIAGARAADVLAKVLLEISPDPRLTLQQGLFLGIAHNPSKYPLGHGDFVVRNLTRIDADQGALVVSEHVQVGQTVQFHVLNRDAAHQDLLLMLTRLRVRLANRPPQFGLYFNCVGRGQALFGSLHHDVSLIRETLGEFPLAGFFSNAELAPLNDVNYVHQYTGVLAVFA